MNATFDAYIDCEDLDATIEQYKTLGYRLDMIFPADDPRVALLSKDGEELWLWDSSKFEVRGSKIECEANLEPQTSNLEPRPDAEWILGRAGMEYLDLIPGRLGGKVIASHIRITEGGEVPDYVHYHKVDFQMIYCKRGRIQVVYEDQGLPFWLEPGDCVLQPSEIRHRVLYAEAGSEVIEVSAPAEHQTWVEHDIELPNSNSPNLSLDFNGQRFVHHIAADAEWIEDVVGETTDCSTSISSATGGLVSVSFTRGLKARFEVHEDERLIIIIVPIDQNEYLAITINQSKRASLTRSGSRLNADLPTMAITR